MPYKKKSRQGRKDPAVRELISPDREKDALEDGDDDEDDDEPNDFRNMIISQEDDNDNALESQEPAWNSETSHKTRHLWRHKKTKSRSRVWRRNQRH
jgi:hypothetical protein